MIQGRIPFISQLGMINEWVKYQGYDRRRTKRHCNKSKAHFLSSAATSNYIKVDWIRYLFVHVSLSLKYGDFVKNRWKE